MSKLPVLLTNIFIAIFLLINANLAVATGVELTGRTASDMQLDKHRKPAEIIAFADVKFGDTVLDLLAGGGYYSELLARTVGKNGNVTLQIPQAYLSFIGDELDKRLANNRLPNVQYLLSEAANLQLPPNAYDSAFLVLGYHDMFFTDGNWHFPTTTVMPQVAKAIKLGGKLLVVDHQAAKGRGEKDTKTLHRIEADFVIEDLKKYGFSLVKCASFLENNNDDHNASVFSPELRRKTDRFVMLFERTK